ncbi:PTS sugar transporter subunit IIB [Enterococcus sp. DIV0086]|uniref:PTS sugar transporter subunit IIB n=1 Tax=Enterococcus sp. DIV0086 TaxID=2774655 RepID=UPI003D2C4ECD
MIQLIRIDDRLLHGQVAYNWKAYLGYEAIVIVSDSASSDDMRKMALKMAKPENVKLAIRTTENAIKLLNNEKLKKLNVFVVTDTIESAKKLFDGISERPLLNIGGIQKADNKEPITSYAYVTEEDKGVLNNLKQSGIKIEFRLVPSDKPKTY